MRYDRVVPTACGAPLDASVPVVWELHEAEREGDFGERFSWHRVRASMPTLSDDAFRAAATRMSAEIASMPSPETSPIDSVRFPLSSARSHGLVPIRAGRFGRRRSPIQASAAMWLATSSTAGLRMSVHHWPTYVTMPIRACA